ncbi:MAG: hypothetical protein H6581_14090 [Bacteroidia bacterium]|nr:hypothetical protein [Bacteroidia bacterium]
MARTDSIISRFPAFFRSEDRLNNLYRLVEVFGAQVDIAEEDLIKVMRSHWVNTANNEGSKGFDTDEKGDLDGIFALYVEALGGTSLLKQQARRQGADGIEDDVLYRDRIMGLIKVLRSGASTKVGIIAIVAANLGIVGDSEAAKIARNTIRVEEFLPESAPTQPFELALFENFQVENPNYVDITPQVKINVTPSLGNPIVDLTLTNLKTGISARYPGTLQAGDELKFLTNGMALLNGNPVTLTGATPYLQPGFSEMRIEGGFGMPAGYFDQNQWDFALFQQTQVNSPGIFDQNNWDQAVFSDGSPILDVEVSMTRFTPGTFMVRIPWDIPGYTEVLDNLADKPREKIGYIVEKVKAAGTFATVAYEKYFTEVQEHQVELTLQDKMPLENHEMEEANFTVDSITTPYPGGLNHDLSDSLTLSGVFDMTSFDSLNTFA